MWCHSVTGDMAHSRTQYNTTGRPPVGGPVGWAPRKGSIEVPAVPAQPAIPIPPDPDRPSSNTR
jgi:hypothetical protein